MVTVPDARPEVVELLKQLFVRHVECGDAGEVFASRWEWSTGAERRAALARARSATESVIAAYRLAADVQDAELRRGPWSDDDWLRGIGVAQ